MAQYEWILGEPAETFDVYEWVLGKPAVQYELAAAGDVTVEPSAMGLNLGGQIPSINYDFKHAVSDLALSLSLSAPTIKYTCTITPSAQGLTMTLQEPQTNYDYKFAVAALALALSLKEPTVNYDFKHAAGAALALSLSSPAPTVDIYVGVTVTPSALGMTVTIQIPQVNFDYKHIVSTQLLAAALKSPHIDTGLLADSTLMLGANF